jgi:endoglucanase
MNRRTFIATTAAAAAAISLGPESLAARKKNKLPQWKGFNLLDFFSPNPNNPRPGTSEDHFRWMQDWGFNFVRVPMAYPSYLNIDRSKNITPEDVYKIDEQAVGRVDNLVQMAHKYGMHVSLNLHRAPGYCVNAGFHEPYNLWRDQEALDAFCFHWNMWAKRYKDL